MRFGRKVPLLFADLTDVGLVREQNEDALGYFHKERRHVFVVADGMGGEAGGSTASRMAVAAVESVFERLGHIDPPSFLREAVLVANDACLQGQQSTPELGSMGTTLEILVIEGDKYWFAHVGDSRIYKITARSVEALTKDQTLVQRMLDDGLLTEAEAGEHPQRNVLNQVIGRSDSLEPQITEEPFILGRNETFVLCSDGLTDLVSDDEIHWITTSYGPQRACRRLVNLALARGGTDNVTVQVVHKGHPQRAWKKVADDAPIPATFVTDPVPPPTTTTRPNLRGIALLAGAALLLIGTFYVFLTGSGNDFNLWESAEFDLADLDASDPPPTAGGISAQRVSDPEQSGRFTIALDSLSTKSVLLAGYYSQSPAVPPVFKEDMFAVAWMSAASDNDEPKRQGACVPEEHDRLRKRFLKLNRELGDDAYRLSHPIVLLVDEERCSIWLGSGDNREEREFNDRRDSTRVTMTIDRGGAVYDTHEGQNISVEVYLEGLWVCAVERGSSLPVDHILAELRKHFTPDIVRRAVSTSEEGEGEDGQEGDSEVESEDN